MQSALANPHRLRVLATDRAAVADFQSFCRETGNPLLANSLLTITGPYRTFGEHFKAALALTAKRRGIELRKEDGNEEISRSCNLVKHAALGGDEFDTASGNIQRVGAVDRCR